MSLESVQEFFKQYHMEDHFIYPDETAATVELAAEHIGCKPEEVCKTMSFLVHDQPVIIAMAGDARIQNHKYKNYFHVKAKMLQGEQVEQLTGHPIGGVCPFGLKEGCVVYLDESLKRFPVVYPAAGSPYAALRLTLDELVKYSGFKDWIDVTTYPGHEE